MTVRQVRAVALVLLVAALGWQTVRVQDRLEAGRLLARVEARTQDALARRRAPSTMFAEHLDWLARAGELDPSEIGVPIARGTQYLLLRRPADALSAYQEASRLEPRPEVDLNIGRAHWMAGNREQAVAAFRRAVRLNPRLAAEVPPEARPLATP